MRCTKKKNSKCVKKSGEFPDSQLKKRGQGGVARIVQGKEMGISDAKGERLGWADAGVTKKESVGVGLAFRFAGLLKRPRRVDLRDGLALSGFSGWGMSQLDA